MARKGKEEENCKKRFGSRQLANGKKCDKLQTANAKKVTKSECPAGLRSEKQGKVGRHGQLDTNRRSSQRPCFLQFATLFFFFIFETFGLDFFMYSLLDDCRGE